MHPLGTKAYLLKRYSPSDSFWTFFSESCFQLHKTAVNLNLKLKLCTSTHFCKWLSV